VVSIKINDVIPNISDMKQQQIKKHSHDDVSIPGVFIILFTTQLLLLELLRYYVYSNKFSVRKISAIIVFTKRN
jgi:hypothetical protein